MKYIVAHLVKDRVLLLNRLWRLEEQTFNMHDRVLAFFLRSLYRRVYQEKVIKALDPGFPLLFARSPFEPLAQEFAKLWDNLTKPLKKVGVLQDLPVHLHEEVADRLLALADFCGPSPDVRIRILLNLASLHNNPRWSASNRMHNWPAESAIAYFHAGALIAEVLSTVSVSVSGLSADMFLNACPSAKAEARFTGTFREIRKETPKLIGFCDSQYFRETVLFSMVREAVEICRNSQLFGISQRGVSLLSSVMQARGLWKLFELTLSSVTQLTKEAATRAALETFWLTIFENGDRYVHHESGFADLEQFGKFIAKRAECVAERHKIFVIKKGHDLDPKEKKSDVFRVLVRKIDPYLTQEENQNHRSVFERSFGAVRFFCDIAKRDGGAQRTIITLPHGLPYINSRVLIPKDGIETVELKPIVVSCGDLQKKITEMNDALDVEEIRQLQPLIKGTLLTEVNDGWKAFPEKFLQESVEDEDTIQMRHLLKRFLETLERGVEFHGKDPGIARQPLHLMFCSALDQMRIAMRPSIGPRCKLPPIK